MEVNHIYNIDCIKGMKENLMDNSISLVCTSPPYFNARDYAYWNKYEDYLAWLKEVFSEVYRVLKEGRMCVVNISPILIPRESRQHESKRLNLPAHFSVLMEEIGFKFLEDIIWIKPEGAATGRGRSFTNHKKPCAWKPNVCNEYIFVFQKPMKGLIDKIVRGYQGEILEKSLVGDDYEMTNIWYMNPVTKSKHPAPYPKELSDRVVEYYSYVEDTVLDPFMGRGTTAISCLDYDRFFVGFEYKEEFVQLAYENMESFKKTGKFK